MTGQTGPKRTKMQRKEDLVFISDLYVKGVSIRSMSKQLERVRKYKVSYVQIQKDLKSLVAEWRKDSIKNIEDRKLVELAKVYKIECEAWKAYDLMSTFRAEGDVRSAKFLDIAMKCIEKRCRIFGIDQPEEVVLQRQIIVVNLPAVDGAETGFSNYEILEGDQ